MLALRLLVSYMPQFAMPFRVVFLTLSGVLAVWQIRGGLRAADLGMRDTGDLFRALALYAGVLVVAAMTLVQAIDQTSTLYFQAETPKLAEVPLLPLDRDGRTATVTGAINFSAFNSLVRTLDQTPTVNTLRLNSRGGNVFAARAMALHVSQGGLSTRVDNNCFSACTIVFLAGQVRILGPHGQLGFHGYAFDSTSRVQTFDVTTQEARDIRSFRAQGVSDAFLTRAFSVKPPNLWKPDRAELIAAGVVSR